MPPPGAHWSGSPSGSSTGPLTSPRCQRDGAPAGLTGGGQPRPRVGPDDVGGVIPNGQAPCRRPQAEGRRCARTPSRVQPDRMTTPPAVSPFPRCVTPPAPVPPRGRASRGVLVAVTGASGGLGASVVSAGLAVRAAAAGRTACAVDLDPLGGGLDVVLGVEQTEGTRWGDLVALDGEADGEAVLPTLPRVDGVRVLSHDRHGAGVPSSVVRTVVAALVGVCDLVVLDLPRPGRLPCGSPPTDHHVVIAGTTLAHVAALSAVLTSLAASDPENHPPVDAGGAQEGGCGAAGSRVVVLRAGSPSGADPAQWAPALQRQLGARVLGVVPDDRSVAADLAHGFPPGGRSGPLTRALDLLLVEVLQGRRSGAA